MFFQSNKNETKPKGDSDSSLPLLGLYKIEVPREEVKLSIECRNVQCCFCLPKTYAGCQGRKAIQSFQVQMKVYSNVKMSYALREERGK